MKLDVRADIREARIFLSTLDEGTRNRVLPRVLNRTISAVQTEAVDQIWERRALKKGVIKGQMRVARASRSKLGASLTVSGQPIPIRHFANAGKRAVTVRVTRKGKRRPLMEKGRKAFINPTWGGGNVFVRTSDKRLPIRKWAPVPGLPRVFVQNRIVAAMTKVAREVFMRRAKHEVEREISRAASKAKARGG